MRQYEAFVLAPQGAPPTPAEGQLYYDQSQRTLFWYNNSAWVAAQAGSGAPSGPAGGSLTGTYPNPVVAPGAIVDSMIASNAAISEAKLALAVDAAPTVPSRRTLGSGAQQALPGTVMPMRRRAGRWYLSPFATPSTATVTMTNLTWLLPFVVERPITISAMAIYVMTAGTGGTVRLGLYTDDGQGEPNTLVYDGGTVPVTSTGMQTATFATAQTLSTLGVYWMAVMGTGLTGSPVLLATQFAAPNIGGTAINQMVPYSYASAASLPNPLGPIAYGLSQYTPSVAYQVSAFT